MNETVGTVSPSLRLVAHTPGPLDRLRAELAANEYRTAHEPVTDSSLTYGDLRLMSLALTAPPFRLAEILADAEPDQQPDDSATRMEINIETARKVAWRILAATGSDWREMRLRTALEKIGRMADSYVNGSKLIRVVDAALNGTAPPQETEPCRGCGGAGSHDFLCKEPCADCGGTGLTAQSKAEGRSSPQSDTGE